MIAENIHEIQSKIAPPARLMVVSKTQTARAVEEALSVGHRLFGENRVQEAAQKYPALREKFSDLELHLIGPLQTNKVKQAVALFDAIQTVDRPELARALAREMHKQNRRPRLFIEINIGEELQKAGIRPEDAADFLRVCREDMKLDICGVMVLPPAGENPEPYFLKAKGIADGLGLAEISMGMSADFKIAAACGATLVRVGTAIFGARS